ncbi:Cytokine-dependent hematopoietic cell linker [Apodemus speciosus]|uniref:Cytokine-dependent hematopoietic cell linker n=1 Tax=Apodemus speciosus TaxID=105296 RepID=A0ABQ0ERG3_APOSI
MATPQQCQSRAVSDSSATTSGSHGEKCSSNNDYEDPELQLLKAWPSMKILPARPIQESEYADTRYFKDMMEAPLLFPPKAIVSTERQTRDVGMKQQDEMEMPTFMGVRSQHFRGFKYTKVNKTPLPPPRQRSTKDFRKDLGAEEESHHQMKPESSYPSPNQSTQKSPPVIASSSYMPGKCSIQARDRTDIMRHCPPQRCQAAASHSPRMLPYENTNSEKPVRTKPDEKDVRQNEWYIGEYSRQAVEEVLMKENKDGTFLVRDCSTKSKAEPFVLVVFYGNKVYNVKIRFLESNQQFALGTGLRGNEMFDSVEDIIEHYTYFPILLIDGKDKAARREQCYLTQPLPLARLLLTQSCSQALHGNSITGKRSGARNKSPCEYPLEGRRQKYMGRDVKGPQVQTSAYSVNRDINETSRSTARDSEDPGSSQA